MHRGQGHFCGVINKRRLSWFGERRRPGRSVEAVHQAAKGEKVKVIVCATRTRGDTVAVVNQQSPEFEIEYFEKKPEPLENYEETNRAMAKKIVKRVLALTA